MKTNLRHTAAAILLALCIAPAARPQATNLPSAVTTTFALNTNGAVRAPAGAVYWPTQTNYVGRATVTNLTAVTAATTGTHTIGTLAVTGNATVGGTLGVTGASTLASAGITGNATVGGTLNVTGTTTVGTIVGVSAAEVSLADAGNYFTGTTVEAALQEAGPALGGGPFLPLVGGTLTGNMVVTNAAPALTIASSSAPAQLLLRSDINQSTNGVGQIVFRDTAEGQDALWISGTYFAGEGALTVDVITGGTARTNVFEVNQTGILSTVPIYSMTGGFIGIGSGLTALNADNLASGTVGTARLGSGTANSTTYLRGDQTWATVSAGIGGTLGIVDNALSRADGTGGATAQGSDILLDDAGTGTQAAVGLSNAHAGQSNSSLYLAPKGTGAFYLGPRADGTATGGNARGAYAVDLQLSRDAATKIASGAEAFIGGGGDNTASGANSVVVGGGESGQSRGNAASGAASFVGAGKRNAASGNNSAVVAGDLSTASGTDSFIGGGNSNTASGNLSAIPGGGANTSSGTYTVASGFYGVASLYGQHAAASGRFAASGDAQSSRVTVRRAITGTAAAQLFLDGSSLKIDLGTASRVLACTVSLAATINSVGNGTGGLAVGDTWAGRRHVVIKRVGNDAATALVGTVETIGTDKADANMAGAVVTITADTSDGSLKIEFTPATLAGSTTVTRAVALVEMVELAP